MQLGTWTLVGALGLGALGAVGWRAARGSSCCATTAAAHEVAPGKVASQGGSGAAGLAGVSTATLTIEGMSCGSCAVGVKRALGKIPGVADVKMLDKGAVVQYDPAKSTTAQLVDAVNELGYKATLASDVKS